MKNKERLKERWEIGERNTEGNDESKNIEGKKNTKSGNILAN
jgi:hypothetical protein